MESLLQSATARMSATWIPLATAAEVDAPLTEWAENTAVSTPAATANLLPSVQFSAM